MICLLVLTQKGQVGAEPLLIGEWTGSACVCLPKKIRGERLEQIISASLNNGSYIDSNISFVSFFNVVLF